MIRLWAIPVLSALVLVATCVTARAADPPELPPGVTCSLVRAKVAEHGKLYAFAWAKLQGYSAAQIKEARRCLK